VSELAAEDLAFLVEQALVDALVDLSIFLESGFRLLLAAFLFPGKIVELVRDPGDVPLLVVRDLFQDSERFRVDVRT
jgi:hypothetical protein